MAGFYVDMGGTGETVLSPTDITFGTIAEDLQAAAQVIEMLLIKDHSRMKFYAATPYDSTTSSSIDCCPSPTPKTGLPRQRSSNAATTARTGIWKPSLVADAPGLCRTTSCGRCAHDEWAYELAAD